MAEARRSESWDHTAALLACVTGTLSGEPVSPDDLHPFKAKKPDAWKMLSDAFGGNSAPSGRDG